MKIFICDDIPTESAKYSNLITELGRKHKIPVEVTIFNGGNELLFALEDQKTPFDLLFLDINMPKMDGIELARKLKSIDTYFEIIFLTVSKEHFLPAFDVEAFNYIIKDGSIKRFEEVFLKAYERYLHKQQKYLVFTGGGTYRNIPIQNISYFEVDKRIVTVHYNNEETFEFFSTIGKLEEQLYQYDFLRCHRSFLVAYDSILSLNKEEIKLQDGQIIPVGRSYYPRLREIMKNKTTRL